MKKWIFAFVFINLLIMCDKAKITEINNTIQQADSLITKTQSDISTIDSIGKSFNLDSINLNKILKEKDKLENIYKDNKGAIDSLSAKISNFKDNIDKVKLQKQFDSLNAILTKTENRIKNIEQKKPTPESKNQVKTIETERKISPVEKTAKLEINVENINEAKQKINNIFTNTDAVIITENYLNDGEFNTLHLTAKVNLEHFDNLVENTTNNLGSIRSKNIETKGADYLPYTKATMEIILYESLKIKDNVNNASTDETEKTFSNKAWDAIKSGGNGLGSIIILLLPFWPIALIALIIFLVINHRKKKSNKNHDDSSEKNS